MEKELLKTAFSVEALHESFMEIRKDIAFKYKVQEYRIRELAEIAKFREAYANGTYKMANTSPFWIKERGHERYITPIAFSDRVVIHSFCKNVLIPKELRARKCPPMQMSLTATRFLHIM